ncbi:glutathione S-transferase [Sphingosinicella microcystinivorans]|uniref:Glutathione S-transferase n=2 Tax=Sphingosinicella microcystinivorans TaxID=335406 RepID=A0ABX9SZB7_SPHMI|nr:glutathione S-transferase [Sphingosinicella microcystinivorans]
MQLLYSPTSPYARKVRMVLIELGLDREVQQIACDPMGEAAKLAELVAANPLGKVPVLILTDGLGVFDSRVICDHLDRLAPSRGLIPIAGAHRDRVLATQALADGILDAAFSTVVERRRPPEERSASWLARWEAAIRRSVAAMRNENAGEAPRDLGEIATAVALDYLLFRLPSLDWQSTNPAMADWLAGACAWRSFGATRPPAGV